MIPDRLLSSKRRVFFFPLRESVCHPVEKWKRDRQRIWGLRKTYSSVLEVLKENVQSLGLNTIVLDDYARAANDLTGVTLTVDFAKTSPGTKDLSISNLDEVDFVLGAESLNELQILRFSDGLDENAQMRLALVESLRTFTETARETVMDEGVLQDLL